MTQPRIRRSSGLNSVRGSAAATALDSARSRQRRQENSLPGVRRGWPALRLRRSDHSRAGRAVPSRASASRYFLLIGFQLVPGVLGLGVERPQPRSCPATPERRSCSARRGPRQAKRPDPSPAVHRCRARAGSSPPLREPGPPGLRAGRRVLSSADAAGETFARRPRFRPSAPPAPRPGAEGTRLRSKRAPPPAVLRATACAEVQPWLSPRPRPSGRSRVAGRDPRSARPRRPRRSRPRAGLASDWRASTFASASATFLLSSSTFRDS